MMGKKIPGLVAALVMCSVVCAAGDNDGADRKDRHIHPKERYVLMELDLNGDCILSAEEKLAARPVLQARMKKQLKEYDKNGDGKLSSEEMAPARKAMIEKVQAFMKKYDADKDGKLSVEEYKNAHKEMKKKKAVADKDAA